MTKGPPLAKVESFTTVWRVISVRTPWRWAVTSNERAVANARGAATECSRLRLERAEVELFLEQYAAARPPAVDRSARVGTAGR
jgi:hypothetical protein